MKPDRSGEIERIATFKANAAGAAIVTAVTQLRAIVSPNADKTVRRYLVIIENGLGGAETLAQVQQ